MTTITLISKEQLTVPRQRCEALGLAAGARLQASIDAQGRLVLVPSRYEPADLFRHRPPVDRVAENFHSLVNQMHFVSLSHNELTQEYRAS